MLAITAVLIFVASTSGDKVPKMWGSRVVGKPSGPSDTMYYEYNDKFETVLINDSVLGVMTIESGRCILSGRYHWGSPCSRGANYANITMQNVTAQKIMEMDEDTVRPRVASTTFFVPRCNFTRPPAGEVDVWTSFPLSRFVKDMPSFTIEFAVRGANYNSTATFDIGAVSLCFWRGTKLLFKGADFCVDMVKDEKADLRIFRGVFQRRSDVTHDSYVFAGHKTVLVVSVDYSQSGISPEVEECKKYNKVKSKTVPTENQTEKTTSSGPALTLAFHVVMASLLVAMFL